MKKILIFIIAMLALATMAYAVPTATVIARPTSGAEPLDVAFTCTGSGGTGTLTYSWNFGDGQPSTDTKDPSHQYSSAGSYTAVCTVTDNADSTTATASQAITVNPVLVLPGEVLIGGTGQRRSNPDADDEPDQNFYAQKAFTITNNKGAALSNVDVVVGGGATSTKYNVTFVTSLAYTAITNGIRITSLPVGGSPIIVKARVPEDLDGVNSDLEEAPVVIGTITASASGVSNVNSELKMQAENQLKINDMDITVDDIKEDIDDGDKVDEIKPGASIELEISVENTFNDNDPEDITIQDVEVTVESDNELDVDEEESVGDVEPNTKEVIKVQFEIDSDADDGTSELRIRATGEDENGAKHGEEWTISLKVERKSHEIEISQLRITPEEVSCDRNIQVDVELKNIGKRDEDEAAVQVRGNNLGFNTRLTDLEIDENDELSKTFTFTVPDDVAAGNYQIFAKAFYNTNQETDSEERILVVKGCGEVVPPDEGEPEEQQNIHSGTTAQATITAPISLTWKGEEHAIVVSSVNSAAETATVVFSSTPITLSLTKGTPVNIDVNSDGKDDLIVTMLAVSPEGVVSLYVQEITYGTEAASLTVSQSYTAPLITGEVITAGGFLEGNSYLITLIVVDVIIVLIAVLLISRWRRK